MTVYADGVAIGSADATSTSMVVTTNGSYHALGRHAYLHGHADGPGHFRRPTAAIPPRARRPTWTASVRRASKLQVFTSLAVTSTPATSAKVGQTYTYAVQTNAPSGDTVTVTPEHGAHRHDVRRGDADLHLDARQRPGEYVARTSARRLPTPWATRPRSVRWTFRSAAGVPPVEIPLNSSAGRQRDRVFSGSTGRGLRQHRPRRAHDTPPSTRPTPSRSMPPPARRTACWSCFPPAPAPRFRRRCWSRGPPVRRTTRSPWSARAGPTRSRLAGGTVTANGLETQMANVQKLTLAGCGGNDDYSARFQHHAHRGRRYGRLQHAGLQPGQRGREPSISASTRGRRNRSPPGTRRFRSSASSTS